MAEQRRQLGPVEIFCRCVKHFPDDRTDGLLNTGTCVSFPHFVRNTIFLCGYKESRFPCHCMVGPDWAVMVATSLSIIIPSVLFLVYVAENISRYMTIADGILVSIVVVSHWITACTDPGTVYCLDENLYDTPQEKMTSVDVEQPEMLSESTNTNAEETQTSVNPISPLNTSPPSRMECHVCGIMRPVTAKHCYTCGTCVDHLDHHCPFTGKCIGRKNYYTFMVFVQLIGLHAYFVIGTTAYFVVARLVIPAF